VDNPFLLHVEKNRKENVRFSCSLKIASKPPHGPQENSLKKLHNNLVTTKRFFKHTFHLHIKLPQNWHALGFDIDACKNE